MKKYIKYRMCISSYYPDNTWRTSIPEKQGVDSEILAKIVSDITNKNLGIHSLLVIRNGYMVLDAHFYPFAPNTKHDIASASKSIMSLLIGIAIDNGYIKNVNEKVLEFFPHTQIQNFGKKKAAITVENLLTMTSGLFCENIRGRDMTVEQMMNNPNWLEFVLNRPMKYSSRTHWAYNSCGVYLLSAILSETSSLSALDFALRYLFRPLGIHDVNWTYDSKSRYNLGWGDLYMTPHDMAKIGYLVLNNGVWKGKQIVSSKWIQSAIKLQVNEVEKGGEGYGYLWWLSKNKKGIVYAKGRGGQYIVIWPDRKTIIVSTGAIPADEVGDYLASHFLCAITSKHCLPTNEKGYNLLNNALKKAQTAQQTKTNINSSPEIVDKISGREFTVASNTSVKKFSLTFIKNNNVIVRATSLSKNSTESQVETYLVSSNSFPQKYLGKYCIPGIRSGYWISDKTFVIDDNEIANNHHCYTEITFKDDGTEATVYFREKTSKSEEIFKPYSLAK